MTDINTIYKYEIKFYADKLAEFRSIEKALKKFISADTVNINIVRTQIDPVYGYVDEEMKCGGIIDFEEGEIVHYPEDYIVEINVKKK